ncbi:MAG: ectonucleotide pyrophosphatase/phosphodiesterase [Fimbriimonadaceae bacterium]|nr:ectonucleotide pyrophosphatase/phosphodiesterase [Fimbriimonadaceae bacterium]
MNQPRQQQKPYVVLVSFDGLRADFLDRFEAPNFHRVMRQGTRAKSLIPVFPSLTFPAHYSIASGMYTDRHGIVGMTFFDPSRGETFSPQDASVRDGSWFRGEPIWVRAEKQGMVSGSCLWFGSEAAIQGIRPTFWKKFDASLSNDARVDTVMEWLRLPAERRPHLVTLYFGDVDGAGHRFGPDAPEVEAAMLRVDQALGRLLDGIASLPFADNVIVVLVSYHGMAKVTKELTVPMESLTSVEGLRTYGAGSQMNVWVDGGQARARVVRDEINAKINHGRAYTREEIPASLHYRSDPRIGDVVIVMEEPWRVLPPKGGTRDMTTLGGWHGWNPASPTMHGIFVAMGRASGRMLRFQASRAFTSIRSWRNCWDLNQRPTSTVAGTGCADRCRTARLARQVLWPFECRSWRSVGRCECRYAGRFLPYGIVGIREMGGDLADVVLRW